MIDWLFGPDPNPIGIVLIAAFVPAIFAGLGWLTWGAPEEWRRWRATRRLRLPVARARRGRP